MRYLLGHNRTGIDERLHLPDLCHWKCDAGVFGQVLDGLQLATITKGFIVVRRGNWMQFPRDPGSPCGSMKKPPNRIPSWGSITILSFDDWIPKKNKIYNIYTQMIDDVWASYHDPDLIRKRVFFVFFVRKGSFFPYQNPLRIYTQVICWYAKF